MADIDILLALRGARQSVDGLGKVQAAVLRTQEGISKGAAVVTSFDSAWREFNTTGQVSVSTMASMASALPGLANPIALVAAAVGATVLSFKMLKDQDAKDALQRFGWAADVAAESIHTLAMEQRNQLAIVPGAAAASIRLAQNKRQLAQAESDFAKVLAKSRAIVAGDPSRLSEQFDHIGEQEKELKKIVSTLARKIKADEKQIEQAKALNSVRAKENELEQQRSQGGMGLDAQIELERELLEVRRERITLEGDIAVVESNKLDMLLAQKAALEELAVAQETLAEISDTAAGIIDNAVRSTAATAYDAYVEAVDKAIAGQNMFAESTGRAMQNALAAILETIGREAAVQAILETAKGFAALAVSDPRSSLHFASAAAFAATAAYAGAASAALSVAPAGGGGSGGAGAGGGGGGSSSAADTSQVFQQIIVIGELDATAAEDLNQQLAKARENRDLSDF